MLVFYGKYGLQGSLCETNLHPVNSFVCTVELTLVSIIYCLVADIITESILCE